MKKSLLLLANILASIVGLCLLILFLPVICIYALYEKYSDICALIRKDPKVTLNIGALKYDVEITSTSVNSAVDEFNRIAKELAAITGSRTGETEITYPKHNARAHTYIDTNLKAVIKNDIAKIELTASLQVDKSSKVVIFIDPEDECCGDWQGISARVIRPRLSFDKEYSLANNYEAAIIVGFLSDNIKFTKNGKQMWCYLEDYSAWLVRYDTKKNIYGYRKKFYKEGVTRYGLIANR